jgi:CheY-like chemotaxis protein
MESLATLRHPVARREPRVRLLLADADARLRSLVASRACEHVDALIVLEAGDGAEAIRIGLQQRPQLALLDVDMPRLGGIEVAMTLRELRPQMRLALQSADSHAHRDRARECRLPLFDKLEIDRAYVWLELRAQSLIERPSYWQKRSIECSTCGYGIARPVPPRRCPMCQRQDTWIFSPRRPYTAQSGLL